MLVNSTPCKRLTDSLLSFIRSPRPDHYRPPYSARAPPTHAETARAAAAVAPPPPPRCWSDLSCFAFDMPTRSYHVLDSPSRLISFAFIRVGVISLPSMETSMATLMSFLYTVCSARNACYARVSPRADPPLPLGASPKEAITSLPETRDEATCPP